MVALNYARRHKLLTAIVVLALLLVVLPILVLSHANPSLQHVEVHTGPVYTPGSPSATGG